MVITGDQGIGDSSEECGCDGNCGQPRGVPYSGEGFDGDFGEGFAEGIGLIFNDGGEGYDHDYTYE